MALIPLTNDGWSYESNCFVCEASNDHGLQIPFFHDTEASTVTASFTLDNRYSGAPSFVHGGVALAIIDEAMAWAAIAIGKKFALTVDTSTSFVFPVLSDTEHTVVAKVDRVDEAGLINTSATVTSNSGELCATSAAVFHPVSEAQAATAVGAGELELTSDERQHLRE